MTKKQHQKQIARARQQRRATALQRRATRNRVIVVVVIGLLVVSLVVGASAGGLFGEDDEVEPPDDEVEPSDDEQAAEGPCGPAPDDVPEIDVAVYDEPFEMTISQDVTYVATVETTCGDIVIELDAQNAPITTNNFVNLAQDGYYNGIRFHRVIDGFMIQGGDPEGTGSGGPGYTFEDELDVAEELYAEVPGGGYPRGTVAMANSGADTNGSQFFVAQGEPAQLPGPNYSVFGFLLEGMDVVDDIAASPTTGPPDDRPLAEVVIRSVTIEER